MPVDIFKDDKGFIKFENSEYNKIINLFKHNITTKRKPTLGLPFIKYYDINYIDVIERDVNQYITNNGISTYAARVERSKEGNIALIIIYNIENNTDLMTIPLAIGEL